jgi:hypothetical protein
VPRFLVESYVSGAPESVAEAERRARRAGTLGGGVEYVRTTFLPGDETILHVFEAPSADAVERAAAAAMLESDRIVEAVEGAGDGRLGAA